MNSKRDGVRLTSTTKDYTIDYIYTDFVTGKKNEQRPLKCGHLNIINSIEIEGNGYSGQDTDHALSKYFASNQRSIMNRERQMEV